MGNGKPGYLDYLPASYQVLGPEQDHGLDKVLCKVAAAVASTSNPAISFRVGTPNVRCRTRVAITLEPEGGSIDVDTALNTTVIATTATLWVALKTRSRGSRVKNVPTRNLVGTGAAPLAIPTDTRLWGYEFEIETNGHELRGVFVPPDSAAVPPAYTWRVVVTYQSVQRLSDEEWNQFLGQRGLTVTPEETVLT